MESVNGKGPVVVFRGCVQKYGWGGYNYIPQIIGEENTGKEPYAELWMGVHPACPSRTKSGLLLSDFIDRNPAFLGGEHSGLPYLCKVLDVRDMLSIQLHPNIEKAKTGFTEEEKKGIPGNAFERTYKDSNHKPELMYALSDFYLLHGFREDRGLIKILSERKSLAWAKNEIELRGLPEFYSDFMLKDQDEINQLLSPLREELEKSDVKFSKDHPDYWALKALQTFCSPDRIDRGLLSIYLFNLVCLREGEVIFQGAGIPHAYLEGQNVEVMSNSDNVIRGGLTKKYIDNRALIELVNFENRNIERLTGKIERSVEGQVSYLPPVKDFKVSVLQGISKAVPRSLRTNGISIIFSLKETIELEAGKHSYSILAGEAALVSAKTTITIKPTLAERIFLVSTN